LVENSEKIFAAARPIAPIGTSAIVINAENTGI
jgi:hypothetical protein